MTQALNMALLGNNVNTSGQVSLTAGVSGVLPTANGGTGGTLPVANGGTGRSTLTANAVLLGNTTTAVQMIAPGTSGNVLRSTGTTWASAAIGEYDGNNFQLFTASGTFTVPAGITGIKVTVRAGGGGGGAGSESCATFSGGSGGFGGLSLGFLTVTPGGTFAVTVGAGGAGSNSTNGSAGGASSFATNFTTTGGGGGAFGSGQNGANGADGTGSGATFNTMIARPEVRYRPRATSATAGVAYAVGSTINWAGGGGTGELGSGGNNASGGVGGAVLVEW